MQVRMKQVEGLLAELANRPTADIAINTQNGITGGGSLVSNRTLSLTGLPLSLFNINSDGILVVGASGTSLVLRALEGASGRITINNANGVASNPIIDLETTGVDTGTYNKVTVDVYGRITAASNQTTLAGLGITDGIIKTGDSMTGVLGFTNTMSLSQPAFTNRAAGTRLLLRDVLSANSADYAIGVGDSNNLWLSVPRNQANNIFSWYAGTVNVATLNGVGDLNLSGKLTATAKSFLINHPLKPDYKLQYASIEAPEYAIVFRGNGRGKEIKLPSHFAALARQGSISVHITPFVDKNGQIPQIGVEDIRQDCIKLSCKHDARYSYVVFAARNDIEKLKVEIKKA